MKDQTMYFNTTTTKTMSSWTHAQTPVVDYKNVREDYKVVAN